MVLITFINLEEYNVQYNDIRFLLNNRSFNNELIFKMGDTSIISTEHKTLIY